MAYPKSNGQAKVNNRDLMHGLKTKLEHFRKTWMKELPSILWSFWTMPCRTMGETSFNMVYVAKAVLPTKIGVEIAQQHTHLMGVLLFRLKS